MWLMNEKLICCFKGTSWFSNLLWVVTLSFPSLMTSLSMPKPQLQIRYSNYVCSHPHWIPWSWLGIQRYNLSTNYAFLTVIHLGMFFFCSINALTNWFVDNILMSFTSLVYYYYFVYLGSTILMSIRQFSSKGIKFKL